MDISYRTQLKKIYPQIACLFQWSRPPVPIGI